MSDSLVVNEIILTIQGEGTRAGAPCVLIRLTGCNLRCNWCDTPDAWDEGAEMSLDEIVSRIGALGSRLVEVTGGEPLGQPATPELLRRLCDAGCETLLETNGSMDIGPVDPRVARIVDFKCPSSGHHHANRWENVAHLRQSDEVKFVIADRQDYAWACRALADHDLAARCPVTFGPVHGRLAPAELAAWTSPTVCP